MYELCRAHSVPHSNCGKLIVAWTAEQEAGLPLLLETALGNGAEAVRIVDGPEMRALEPLVGGRAALFCPTSGIVDSHALMRHFLARAKDRGALPVFGAEVIGLDLGPEGWRVTVREPGGRESSVLARAVVNCAGLESGRVAALAGIDVDEAHYRIHYRKGMYVRVTRNLGALPRRLVYPFPPEDATVGIHTVPDLSGGMRLGPLDVWTDRVEYSVDEGLVDRFCEACAPFLPGLRRPDLAPEGAGIQAKRYGPSEKSRDFVIREESDRGLPGLVNLVGIESPGLTSSPAIGPYVDGLLQTGPGL
jgi:L-2-hydroxyglutarate oxidase LhgO